MQFELKRSDIKSYLVAAWFCLRNAIFGWTLYLTSSAMDLLQTFFGAAGFFFLATYVGSGVEPYIRQLGGDYAAYVVFGFLAAGLLSGLMRSVYQSIATGYYGAVLEFYGSFPLGIPAYLTGAIWFYVLEALVRFAILLFVGMLLFHIQFSFVGAPASLMAMVIGFLPLMGLALMAASTFFLMNAKGWNDPLSWLVETAASLTAGVYFPPEILPDWLRWVGSLIPHRYLLHAARISMLGGSGLTNPEFVRDLVAMGVMALIYVPMGVVLFWKAMSRAAASGQFTRWV